MSYLIGFAGGFVFALLFIYILGGWATSLEQEEEEEAHNIASAHGSAMFFYGDTGEVVALEEDDDDQEVIALEDQEIFEGESEVIALPEAEEDDV